MTLTVANPVVPIITDIQNGADFLPTPAVPGLIVTIRGSNLGPTTGVAADGSSGQFPQKVDKTRVLFDGLPTTVLYASAKQVNAIVPYGVYGRLSTNVTVEYQGTVSNVIGLAIKDASPGIFTMDPGGQGQGAILNSDYSVNSVSRPAAPGSSVMIFATGEGEPQGGGTDGKVIGSDVKHPLLPVTATVGGVPATVQYAGSAPGLVSGALQVNVQIPTTVKPGSVPVVIQVGTAQTQTGVTVAVE